MYSLEEMTQNLRINSPRDGGGLEGGMEGGGGGKYFFVINIKPPGSIPHYTIFHFTQPLQYLILLNLYNISFYSTNTIFNLT